ncbi:MAG: hypothetical protein HYV29_10225 [Ignavibacteriales bacterium]|nr:hypothetical protein [Ignavibacteriales bacterium]
MKKVFLLLVVFSLSLSFGQSITVVPVITEADIINASVLVDPFAEKVKDIAPTTFSLNIINNTQPNRDLKVSMRLEAYVTLEEDRQRTSIFLSPGYAITNKPFLVLGSGRLFTSKDADNPSSDIDFNHELNEPFKAKLKDKILDPASGGRVPSGLYEIHIELTVDSMKNATGNFVAVNEPPVVIDRSVNVTNPTTAILDVPFNNGYVYPTPFPQFQWTYDTRAVLLSVYEKRPEHQSLEDAIGASDPYLQVRITRRASGNLTTFSYPQTAGNRPGVEFIRGPRQLERGKMYVVVLDGITTAFGFDVEPLRTVRSFVISDPQGQVVINLLQNALTTGSGGQFQDIFNSLQDQNLLLNSDGIVLNGVKISTQDLQRLLTENKDRITSVRIED